MQPKPAAHPLACYYPLLLNPPPLSKHTSTTGSNFFKKLHAAGCHLDLGTTTYKYTMIRLYVVNLQYMP